MAGISIRINELTPNAARGERSRPTEPRGDAVLADRDLPNTRSSEIIEDTEFTGRVIGQYQTD